jgi:hypothetical protein
MKSTTAQSGLLSGKLVVLTKPVRKSFQGFILAEAQGLCGKHWSSKL